MPDFEVTVKVEFEVGTAFLYKKTVLTMFFAHKSGEANVWIKIKKYFSEIVWGIDRSCP